jgi:hypothetical protein
MLIRGAHSSTCATGARAEVRGDCDCGAGETPYRARVIDQTDESGKRLVEIQIDGPLNVHEVGLMCLMLHELTKAEAQRWARADMRKKP